MGWLNSVTLFGRCDRTGHVRMKWPMLFHPVRMEWLDYLHPDDVKDLHLPDEFCCRSHIVWTKWPKSVCPDEVIELSHLHWMECQEYLLPDEVIDLKPSGQSGRTHLVWKMSMSLLCLDDIITFTGLDIMRSAPLPDCITESTASGAHESGAHEVIHFIETKWNLSYPPWLLLCHHPLFTKRNRNGKGYLYVLNKSNFWTTNNIWIDGF